MPRGLGIEGISDVDVVIVTYSAPQSINLERVEKGARIIDQETPFINGVELGFFHLKEVMETKHCSMVPFILKIYSICVYGESLISKLPNYKPDSSLANEHLIHLSSSINKAKSDLIGNDDIADIKDCCSWIMKIIVRAGHALVIVQEGVYTRDLFPAFKLFVRHYPEKEQEMKTALCYAINPLSNPMEILEFLNGFGYWLELEAQTWLEVYNPTKAMHLPL